MFERIFDSIFDSVLITDLAGTIMEVNEACCRTLGYEREALLGMDVSSILSEEDAVSILVLARKERKRGLRLDLITVDGTAIPVEVNTQYITHKEKEAILCVARDVTERARAEEALRKKEEAYHAVLEGIGDGYWETDLAGRLTFVNDVMCRMAETTREELLSGVRFSNYADSETTKKIYKIFNEVYRTGNPSELGDHEIIRQNGSKGVFQFNASLIRDKKGQPAGFRGITRDVTERKAMETALRESEESYRNVLALSPDSIAIVRREDATYLQVNDALCRQIGYRADEMIGRTSADLDLYADPADRRRLFEIIAREGQVDGIEIQYRAKDGTILDNLLSVRSIRFRGESCFLIVATVITSLKKAEQALRQSEEKYRTILESMEEGYYEVDLSGRFTFFNSALCRMGGLPVEELMGMRNLEYAAPETAKRIYQVFNKVYRTGKPAEIVDHEIIRKDGSRSIHELSVSLMRDKKGAPIGFRGVVRDVTLRKQAEEEIQTHREHLALINQILRHDLTNDLVVAQSGLNLYKISHEEELLEETEGRVKKSLDLIGRMRELESFMSSHKDLKAYEIRDIISEIAGNYPFINVTVKGKAQVMADDSLFSVIDNITRNAVIHGKSGRIEVTIGQREGMCEVRIADNGSGVPDEIKEAIFEEGFMHGDTGHTGLGLHIVKKAMEKYGGYVYVEDNEPRGAVFVLTFKAI